MAIRGTNGRFVRDPRDGPPIFPEYVKPERTRDGRSGRAQKEAPEQLSLRVPLELMRALRREALRRNVTATNIVLTALKKELHSETQPDSRLYDPVESTLKTLPGNVKLSRIEGVVRSDVRDPIPKHDHVRQQQRRVGSKPPPALMDRRR